MTYPQNEGNALALFDRTIAFHPILVDWTGSIKAALMLSQLIYWTKLTKNPGKWIYKTRKEWWDEIRMTRREQENARAVLVEGAFIEERLSGHPAKMFYRVRPEVIRKLALSQLGSNIPTGRAETAQLVGLKHTNSSETTKEITTRNGSKAAGAVPAEPRAVLLNDLPDTSVPKFSGPVRDFANWSRSKGFHVRLRLSPTDIKYAKGGGPGGWSRDTLLAWENAFQQFIKRVPAQQVGSVLSLYIKEHVLLTQERNAPVCQTFLTFLERFDWIDRTVRQLKQFRKRESGTEDGQPEWTPAE